METGDSTSGEWAWVRLNMHYDPVPALGKVRCPVLALFGGADRNVVAADNLPVMRGALERAGNPDVTLVEISGVDHGLREVSPSGAPVPLHRAAAGSAGWDTVRAWLHARFGAAPGGERE